MLIRTIATALDALMMLFFFWYATTREEYNTQEQMIFCFLDILYGLNLIGMWMK